MSIKSRKLFAILVVSMMILTMLPMTAFAATKNSVDRTPQVSLNYAFSYEKDNIPNLIIKDDGHFSDTATAQTFRLILTNAEWIKDDVENTTTHGWVKLGIATDAEVVTKTTAEVTINATTGSAFTFPLYAKVTGEGEAKVTIDPRDSVLSGTSHTFAVCAEGRTINTIDKVVTFARTGKLGTIQIDETRIGSIETASDQSLRIKLPPRFSWEAPVDGASPGGYVNFTGGLSNATATAIKVDGRTLTVTFTTVDRSTRGTMYLKNLEIRADRDAPYGEVLADVEGTHITDSELVVAKYAAYSVEASIKEVKEVTAGRYANNTAKITIKENIPGSMIVDRELTVLLPEWAKINKVKKLTDENFDRTGSETAYKDLVFASNKNEIYFVVPKKADSKKNSKYEFELELSVQADKSGDVVAEIFGAGMEKQELVIAKAVAPVTAEVAVSDLKIGVQKQPAPDIVITETKKGMIDDGSINDANVTKTAINPEYYSLGATGGKTLTVSLPKNHEFSSTPTVEVTEGNLEIGKPSLGDNKNVLNIPIKSSSTKPSTIKISDVKVTLDRTVPEGPFDAKIGGSAIVKNSWGEAVLSTPVLFAKGSVVSFHFADVITPAPGEIRATTTFTIGETTFTVVEAAEAVEYTMDVAPYIKDGRTFLPLRYVANALGVDDDNIIWDPVTKAVTVFKGDRIAQVTIGSKTMLVNGVTINMDVAPEITDGRTMLPIRWMAQALGANIDWDAEARTVTVTQ